MPTVWNATTRGPSVLLQHVQYPQIFDQSVAEGAIELKDVAIGPHACIPDQIARVLNRKEIFSRGYGTLIVGGQLCLQFIIERIAGFLVPSQLVWFKYMCVLNCCLEIETSICIHRQLVAAL